MSDDKKTGSDKQNDAPKLKDDKKAKVDKKADAKVDKKADVKVDKKADAKVDKKADAKVDKKADPKVDKKADPKVDKKAVAKVDKNDGLETKEKPLADVIPFRTEEESAKDAQKNQDKEKIVLEREIQVELDEVVANIKSAFKDMKEKFAPLRSGVSDIVASVRESGKEAVQKEREARQANEEKAEKAEKASPKPSVKTQEPQPKEVEPAVKAAKETAEVISLAMERLKRRGIEHRIDLKEILAKQFDGFVDKRLKLDELKKDADGRPIVKVDADFVKQHGTEVVPAILGGVTQSIISTLFGDIFKIGLDADKNDEDANKEQDGANEATSEDAASTVVEQPKYRVEFDFAALVSNFMKSAKLAPAANVSHSEEEDKKARKTIIEGARIFEDALNGKEFKEGEAQERLDAAIEDDEKKEIIPIDEKHARILKLTKQFEASLNPDNDEKPKD